MLVRGAEHNLGVASDIADALSVGVMRRGSLRRMISCDERWEASRARHRDERLFALMQSDSDAELFASRVIRASCMRVQGRKASKHLRQGTNAAMAWIRDVALVPQHTRVGMPRACALIDGRADAVRSRRAGRRQRR